MLEIITYTQQNDKIIPNDIDLLSNTSLEIVWENPMFKPDSSPVVFSLDFPIPPTHKNLKIFNFPDRVTTLQPFVAVKAFIKHSGFVIAQGELLLIDFLKLIQVQFRGSVNIADQRSPLNMLPLGQINFGRKNHPVSFMDIARLLNYTDASWGVYRTMSSNAASNAIPNRFVIGPVKIAGTQWEGHEAVQGAYNAMHQYINYYNPDLPGFSFNGHQTKVHTPVVPFLPLAAIIHDAFGDSILANPFSVGDFRKLIIIANNHPNYNMLNLFKSISYDGTTRYEPPLVAALPVSENNDINDWLQWQYANFLTKAKFNQFFTEILKIFGMVMYRGVKHEIASVNDIFDDISIQEWDALLSGFPKITPVKPKDYIFNYKGETSDTEESFFEFDSWELAFQNAFQRLNREEVNYKSKQSPQVLKLTTTIRGLQNQKWILSQMVRSELFGEYNRVFEEDHNVTANIKPLSMNIEHYWWQNALSLAAVGNNTFISRRHWMVPVFEKQKPDELPNIMLWAGMRNTLRNFPGDNPNHQYPLITNHNYDHANNKTHDFSLLPTATDGILNKFHNKMRDWIQSEKIEVEADFKFSPAQLAKINIKHKVHLRGKLFFIEKIRFVLLQKHISLATANLVQFKG